MESKETQNGDQMTVKSDTLRNVLSSTNHIFYLSKTDDFESRGVDLVTKSDTESMHEQKNHANLIGIIQNRSQTTSNIEKVSGQGAKESPRRPRRSSKGAQTSRNESLRSLQRALTGQKQPQREPKRAQRGGHGVQRDPKRLPNDSKK